MGRSCHDARALASDALPPGAIRTEVIANDVTTAAATM